MPGIAARWQTAPELVAAVAGAIDLNGRAIRGIVLRAEIDRPAEVDVTLILTGEQQDRLTEALAAILRERPLGEPEEC